MLPGFCTDSVTRKRAPLVDSRGTKNVRDWTANTVTSKTISGCSVQPASVSGDLDGREQSTENLTLYAPPDADIVKGDHIEWGGLTYTIDGQPYVWNSPTGAVSHMVVPLSHWEG